MPHFTEEWRKDVRALKLYADDLEKREQALTEALSKLTQGYGDVKRGDSNHATSMQRLAGNHLEKIAVMQKRKRPLVLWA